MLRIGVFELLERDDVPVAVVLNEAVVLAHGSALTTLDGSSTGSSARSRRSRATTSSTAAMPRAIPHPEPPPTDGVVVLRPWRAADARALAAAWADPEIQRWTAVPDARGVGDAARWIAVGTRGASEASRSIS